jgi:hypothetical protein
MYWAFELGAGVALAANNPADRDELAAKAAPTSINLCELCALCGKY